MKLLNDIVVDKLPKCDFCSANAYYDGRTIYGAWANMCFICFGQYGVGLGLGKGQELIKKGNSRWNQKRQQKN